MGLLDWIRTWLGGLLGRDPEAEPTDDAVTAEYRCAVCGTEVGDPDGECPLCRSTEIVAGNADPDDGGSASEHTVEADPTTEAALRGVLDGGPLEEHADRWERVDDGYRIERPEGGTERADSRAEARALLSRLYG